MTRVRLICACVSTVQERRVIKNHVQSINQSGSKGSLSKQVLLNTTPLFTQIHSLYPSHIVSVHVGGAGHFQDAPARTIVPSRWTGEGIGNVEVLILQKDAHLNRSDCSLQLSSLTFPNI